MPIILLSLALVAAAAGAVLWILAARQDKQRQPQVAPQPEPEPELAPPPEPEPAPQPEPDPEPVTPAEKRSFLSQLPGSLRRERKEWAQIKGFEYYKTDDYLIDEFTRGAAAAGAAPKDIVAGQVAAHEMLLMDMDGVGVMAFRTGAASDEVVDFRRQGALQAEPSEDLTKVCEVAGFDVFASDPGVAQRMIDSRVVTALESLPTPVTAAWLESEWALAQFPRESGHALWESLQPALALLADTARVLPPRSQAAQTLHLEDGDPSRAMEVQATMLATSPVLMAKADDDFVSPPIQRPEEPVDLPTRTISTARGPVSHSPLGADEVDAIANGKERPTIAQDQPRVRRHLDGKSAIFDDEN